MNKPFNILFLCTGNSCHSQMAQGRAKRYGELFRASHDDIKTRVNELLQRFTNSKSL